MVRESAGEEMGQGEGLGSAAVSGVSWRGSWDARWASKRATRERMWDLGGMYLPEGREVACGENQGRSQVG